MPKILWMSPYSLHDISSGASIHCKTVLECLAKRGFEVWSCSSFIFDSPAGASVFNNLKDKIDSSKKSVFEIDDAGIHYIYTRSSSNFEQEQNLNDQELLFKVYCSVLDNFKPDFVMGFGTGMISMTSFAEAQRRGIVTIYPVLNGNHGNYAFPNTDLILTDSHASANLYFRRDQIRMIQRRGIVTIYPVLNGNHGNYAFPNTDLILTDSHASANLYFRRDQIRMIPIGQLFDPVYCISNKRKPKYITFINPSFEKGLSIFAKLAQYCQKAHPDLRFLVVNSHGNFAENIQYLHTKGNKDDHPLKPQDFDNVDMTPATNNMKPIYTVSKVLVTPSLWWESWGRVASEAVLNNIPVLGSTSGGLKEATFGAGIHLDAPEHCIKDNLSLPDDDEIKPWAQALERLVNEDWEQQLKHAQDNLSIDKNIDRLIAILRPYYERRYRDHIKFNHH